MNNYYIVYLIWSVIIGLYYLFNWVKYKQHVIVKTQTKRMRLLIYGLILILSSVFAPLSFIELYLDTKNTKEKRKQT